MKLLSHLPVLGAIIATAAASPASPSGGNRCLCKNDAQAILDKYIKFITHATDFTTHIADITAANATGQALFADKYALYSDSVSSLLGKTGDQLGKAAYDDKQTYISQALAAPAFAPGETLGLHIVECNKFIWYFNFDNVGGYGKNEVRGFNLFTTTTDRKQIVQNDFEFNSYAWLQDTGYTCTQAPSGNQSGS